jgi:hypothetical protein
MRLAPALLKSPIFISLSGERNTGVVGLTTENNTESEKKEERRADAQKESTLQPITKANSKLEKELQEWEVESTKGGANDGGG